MEEQQKIISTMKLVYFTLVPTEYLCMFLPCYAAEYFAFCVVLSLESIFTAKAIWPSLEVQYSGRQ